MDETGQKKLKLVGFDNFIEPDNEKQTTKAIQHKTARKELTMGSKNINKQQKYLEFLNSPLNKIVKGSLRNSTLSRLERETGAFTLAEVLITLGVIGVVAAMTLPTLIHNYQVKQWETGLKRSYNILTNGFKKVMSDAGCMDLECTGIFVPNETNTQNTENPEFNDRMEASAKKAFNAIKVCKYGSTDDECNKEYTVKYLKGDGKYKVFDRSQQFSMNLMDGTIVYVQNWGCFKTTLKNRQGCGWLTVDINGDKGPNTYGKDVWGLGRLYSDGRLIPNTSLDWASTSSDDPYSHPDYWRNAPIWCGHAGVKLKDDTQTEIIGQDCAARVMENNWKIDYLK